MSETKADDVLKNTFRELDQVVKDLRSRKAAPSPRSKGVKSRARWPKATRERS